MKFVCILFMIWPWPARVSWCSTHWVMTEDGRIQAQADSMFFMKRPYDFIALAQQERRAASIEELRKELVTHKVEIDRNDDNNQDVEKKVYSEDPHCLKAGQPLTEFNLYPSVAIDLDKDTGVKLESVLDMSLEITSDFQQPDCTKYMPLDFSMFAFEHLVGMKDRASLSMTGEVELADLVGGPEGERVFGHRVDAALQRRPTHWAAYHLAALYWRVQGDAPRAVECARRAVHLASRSMRFVGMVDLGAVLHRCRRSGGGAVLLHAAIDHNDQSWQAHLALGSAYAVLGDYNRSITCFNNTIKLHPAADADARRLNAVICHQRLEQALENQHSSLQNTLSELRTYQKQHSLWLEKQDKLVLEQADLEERVRSRLNHEEHQALQRSDIDVNSCVRVQRDGHGMLDCGVVAADSEHQATANQPIDHTLARIAEPAQEGDADEVVEGPTLSPRYVQLHEQATDTYLSDHWPTAAECERGDTKLPDANSFPTVYLPPQNKGFDVSWYLSEAIGVPATDEHALPWFPPVCEPLAAGRTTSYDQLGVIRRRARYQSRRLADPLAEEALLQLVAAPSQRAVVPAEIGQRITSAIKQGVVPGWLGASLAALYWRSQGRVLNVLECLRTALHDVPALYRDVPLVSLAAMLQRLDDIDSALKVAKHAYQVNDIEPDTNMLLGGLLAVRGNYTGALWHYRRALQADSAYTVARHMLLSVACYSRFQGQKREQQCQTPAQTPVDDDPILDKLAKMPRDSVVCTSECLDGTGQELCESKISCYHAHNDNGRWVLTPTPSGQPECHGATAADVVGGSSSSSMDQLGELLQDPGSCLQDLHPPPLDPMQDEQDHMELMSSLVADPLPLMDALLELQTPAPPPPPADWHQLLELSVTEAVPGSRVDGVDDDELPELLQLPADRPLPPPPSAAECHALRHISVNQLTSTWLSISSKHVKVDLSESDSVVREPVCPELFPASLLTLDSLSGVRHRRQLVTSAESGLREALQTLSGQLHRSVDETAARIAASLQQNGTSWVFNTAAALYWRVRGDGPRAVSCLRVALHYAPRPYRDIPLISLANVLYRAGLYNDALIACNAALDVSPYFVVIHFTMANIYAAKGDTERAMQFYQSTLELQGSFQPARERLRAIQCSLITSP